MKALLVFTWLLLGLFPAQLLLAQPITLVTLGDSLTAGDNDDGIGGGYPARLIALLQSEHPGSSLQNLGISGDTSNDLINKQLAPAVAILNAAPASDRKVALVWIGSNDLFGLYNSPVCQDYYASIEDCENTERGLYSGNIDQILSTLTATGAELYIALLDDQSKRPVMTDPALRMSQFDGITADDVTRMGVQIPLYNNEIQNRASSSGATTVDFFHTTIFQDPATLSDDGNHPNGAGYDLITGIWHQAVSGLATQDIHPQILANGTAGMLTVPAGTLVEITVMLDPGSHVGESADWWAGYEIGGGWFTYIYPTGWGTGLFPAYQGGLFILSPFAVLSEALAAGDYDFYVAVDTTPDGELSFDTLWYDYVRVLVE